MDNLSSERIIKLPYHIENHLKIKALEGKLHQRLCSCLLRKGKDNEIEYVEINSRSDGYNKLQGYVLSLHAEVACLLSFFDNMTHLKENRQRLLQRNKKLHLVNSKNRFES